MVLSANTRFELEEQLEEAKCLAVSVECVISNVDGMIRRITEQSFETIAEIRMAADRLIQAISEYESKAVSQVKEIVSLKHLSLEYQKAELEALLEEVNNAVEYTNDVLNQEVVAEIEEWQGALLRQLQELNGLKFESSPTESDEIEFYFFYEDPTILASVGMFGCVNSEGKSIHAPSPVDLSVRRKVKRVPKRKKDSPIPVIAVNGLVVDLTSDGESVCDKKPMSSLL